MPPRPSRAKGLNRSRDSVPRGSVERSIMDHGTGGARDRRNDSEGMSIAVIGGGIKATPRRAQGPAAFAVLQERTVDERLKSVLSRRRFGF
jgi:hypothetical protein